MTTHNHMQKPKVKRTTAYKHWCLTINNWTAEDIPEEDYPFVYLILGIEGLEEGSTPHLQGYVHFPSRRRLSAVKKVFPRAHLEPMNGTGYQAMMYCKKEHVFFETGFPPNAPSKRAVAMRQRRNWQQAFDNAKVGNFDEIPADMRVRYYRTWKQIKSDNPPKIAIRDTTCGIWLVGPTGCGKSREARAEYPDLFDKPINKWWDGYRDEKAVLLDDVSLKQGEWLGYYLKRWTDHYPFPAEQKGTTIKIRPEQIIVTSQHTIEQIFSHDTELVKALNRRFNVRHFQKPGLCCDAKCPYQVLHRIDNRCCQSKIRNKPIVMAKRIGGSLEPHKDYSNIFEDSDFDYGESDDEYPKCTLRGEELPDPATPPTPENDGKKRLVRKYPEGFFTTLEEYEKAKLKRTNGKTFGKKLFDDDIESLNDEVESYVPDSMDSQEMSEFEYDEEEFKFSTKLQTHG